MAQKHIVTKIRRLGTPSGAGFRNIDSVMPPARSALLVIAFAAAFAAASGGAFAQRPDPRERPMSPAARERLREQVESARRDAYRNPRQGRGRERLTPAQRERLRRDIQDANRDLERRRRR
jgi:hypothetical protein